MVLFTVNGGIPGTAIVIPTLRVISSTDCYEFREVRGDGNFNLISRMKDSLWLMIDGVECLATDC